ncbi:arginase [Clostridium gasigenes]|uniref:Arginase n=1 Tax=Clostridium gasigenes TaxID=94869 RepID=A0A1H0TGY5_9CLOT|nr:arginase [Clostridium gasigenes]MBB6624643.1 arginase [Clostridium gasigenes]MBU3088476.1 arginase [Clostridium gasigenes]MBU3103168.1 arginase [Clostridium gasigenes]MBU3133172.1 arginase [Clostridium gasigenes]NKF07442.1 arginase [Clostridium gasigenes]
MDINLIGVPLYYGCDKKGVQEGPRVLRENGIAEILRTEENKVYDLGDIYIDNSIEKEAFCAGVNAKYINEIVSINNNLAHKVYSALSAGGFPLVIGGDHALAAGSISGVAKYFKDDLAVIWVDAHGDMNTFETSPSGNVHGMPLSALFGVGDKSLTDIYFKGVKVKKENVFIIGARDLDSGEVDLINELDLKVWTMDRIKEVGIGSVCVELYKCLENRGIKNIHLSFDIDSIDPLLMKGTGTPVPNGINMDEAKTILNRIFETRLVKSMDFVEFNPMLDKSGLTTKMCIELMETLKTLI